MPRTNLAAAVRNWWSDQRQFSGIIVTATRLLIIGFEFLRDSLPDRRRQRFGDFDYDWEYRVDTTSANVTWQSRLIGLLSSPYQPVDPELFREMMASAAIHFSDFVFLDIGSGKGRALLLASEYPFQRVIGIELLPELNAIAQQNIARFAGRNPQCARIESFCCDAAEFALPEIPLLLFFNNPLRESTLLRVLNSLQSSLRTAPRHIVVLYANPTFERAIMDSGIFRKTIETHQYAVFENDFDR